ncbi:MAG TPA: (2Fe-2S) ferredoxin domain-containing protein [Nitrospiraceae bacterium]|nr:(2Fe-2S) ferredoxin domain-containing protein [Nitrospiraceae bacterium]
MSEQSVSQSDTLSLDSLTLALVVNGMGVCTDEAVADLRRNVESKAITHTAIEFDASLERAKQYFAEGDAHFFLCDGEPCQRQRRFDAAANALQHEAERIGCRISPTACQGPCKQAPLALLRVGHGCELFAQFAHRREWEAVLGFAQRAAQAKTVLVDAGTAKPFRFDPVHEPEKPSAALESVQFLLGHFEGAVELSLEQRSIQKEVVGSWEAGGRFLSLRMAATYRRTNGSWDRHQAFIILGPDEETGALVSRAYTDGGMVHEFHIVIEEKRLMFADRVPHHVPAVAARKVLTPTTQGYEETLEIDRGSGVFEPYYSMLILRK